MTPVRTVARVGVGTALLSVLAGCSSDTAGDALVRSAPISVAPTTPALTSTADGTSPKGSVPAPADSMFVGSKPVSIDAWWRANPANAPADLAQRTLLFNKQGTGSQRFPGPDMRKFDKILMIITCTTKAEYSLRLQVLDGLSIATTSGDSCGGPSLSSYESPSLTVVDPKTEVEVEVPAGTKYYVTLYGTSTK